VDVTPAIERAVAELEPGGRLVGMQTLTGGVSANIVGLEVVTPAGDERRVVFRQHRANAFKDHDASVAAKEYGVLAALHRNGLAVPEPLGCSERDVDGPYLLMDWIDGTTEPAAGELPAALDQMARFLVAVHRLDPRSLQVPHLEPIEDPVEAVTAHLPSTPTARQALAALQAGPLQQGESRSVLLHGDYWPGNVLWRCGCLVAVIDWEDACLGDPLADLATARVELLCRYGHDAMERFTNAYLAAHHEAIGALPLGMLAVWELYVSATALTSMGQWGLDPDDEALRRRRTEGFFDHAARRLIQAQPPAHPGA
jgi:aminoglycoside phosphotransferase (APT) family kinase protein